VAKVTIDEAIKTASEQVSGKVIEAELEEKDHTLVREVEIVIPENEGHGRAYRRQAGVVIDVEEEKSGQLKRPRSWKWVRLYSVSGPMGSARWLQGVKEKGWCGLFGAGWRARPDRLES